MNLEEISGGFYSRSLPSLSNIFVIASISWGILVVVRSYFRLRHIPGPHFASLTNFARRSWVKTGDAHEIHTALHRQYGSVVRVGPNAVMVSQVEAINQIYGFKTRLEKSEMYDAIMPRIKGITIPDVFATRNEALHRQMRRPAANLYSATNLMTFEPAINSTMDYFFKRLDEKSAEGIGTLDLFSWLQYFMFDVLGQVTFSHKLGCLEKGDDVEGVIENNWGYFKKIAPNTQMQWLDYLGRDFPLFPASAKKNPLAEFGAARIKERIALIESEEEKHSIDDKDYLAWFMKEKAKDDSLPELFVPTWVNTNIVAGADTTSILASALMYHLLKDPASYSKLQKEIDEAAVDGRVSEYVTWKESQALPYLEACVYEATRMHPPFALPFERVVPESGLEIDGYYIPGGTRIGMSPWAVQRDVSLYGENTEAWRPERWLCDEEQKMAMKNGLLTFGAGHRGCIGKNLAYLEIYKLIPSLLQRYEIKLSAPAEDWYIENKWLLKPSGLPVQLSPRR